MLYDFVYYEKQSGRVTGRFRTSDAENVPAPPSDEYAQAQVTDEEHLALLENFQSNRDVLAGRVREGRIVSLAVNPRYQGGLELTTDLTDRDGDGVPEMPADGSATATIAARVVDRSGKPLAQKDAKVMFRVTRGTLSARNVEVKNGVAEVEWKAPAETVQARITARAEGFQEASLSVEFIPPDEHRELSRKTTQR